MRIVTDKDQADWGAQKQFADGDLTGLWVPDKWIIHYGGNASPAAENPALETWALRVYEQSHLSRGWRAIGYNYAVGNSGTTYRLRGENPSGATSGDYEPDGVPENSEARAVLWIGGGAQVPSDAAYAAMRALIEQDPLLPLIVHKDVKGTTSCPGPYWTEWAHTFTVDTGMPRQQWEQLIDALFAGRPDEFVGDPDYWKTLDPDSPDWATDFFPAFVRAISPSEEQQ